MRWARFMIWVLTVAWLPVDAQLEAWMTSTLERTLRVDTLLTTASVVVQAFINFFKRKSTEIITDNSSHSLIFSTEIYRVDDWHSWCLLIPNLISNSQHHHQTHPHSASGQLITCIQGNIHTLDCRCYWCIYVHSLLFCFGRDPSLNNIHRVLIKHTI